MKQIAITYHKCPIGELILGSFENRLCLLDFRYRKLRTRVDQRISRGLKADYVVGTDPVLEQTIEQVEEYLGGARTEFNIPIALTGSEFQKRVWEKLLTVPFGHIVSYAELSNQIGNATAVRAVAAANGANAIALIVPCHRVIGSDGSLTGYGGGLSVKKRLLQLEGSLESGHQGQFNFDGS